MVSLAGLTCLSLDVAAVPAWLQEQGCLPSLLIPSAVDQSLPQQQCQSGSMRLSWAGCHVPADDWVGKHAAVGDLTDCG